MIVGQSEHDMTWAKHLSSRVDGMPAPLVSVWIYGCAVDGLNRHEHTTVKMHVEAYRTLFISPVIYSHTAYTTTIARRALTDRSK